jgi:hypothetical protein
MEGVYLEAAVVVGEQADPSRARHGLGAHHAVLAARVPHLQGDGLGRHGCSSLPARKSVAWLMMKTWPLALSDD